MRQKVLLVTRDLKSREPLREELVEGGYDVVVADDAGDALESAERERPDVTIIEAVESEVSAAELCQELKRSPLGQSMSVVILADVSQDQEDLALLLNRYGCDQLIDRTVPPAQISRMLGKLLETVHRGDSARESPSSGADEELPADSDDLVSALERLDTIMTHRAAGKVVPATAVATDEASIRTLEDSAVPAPDPARVAFAEKRGDFSYVEKELNRDSATAEAFEDGLEATTGSTESRLDSADGGYDIDEHLDALFAGGLPARDRLQPAPPPPPAPVVIEASPRPATDRELLETEPEQPSITAQVSAPATVASIGIDGGTARETRSGIADQVPTASTRAGRPQTIDEDAHGKGWIRWLVAAMVAIVLAPVAYVVFLRDAPVPDEAPVVAQVERPAPGLVASIAEAAPASPVEEPILAEVPVRSVATTDPRTVATTAPDSSAESKVLATAPVPAAQAAPEATEPRAAAVVAATPTTPTRPEPQPARVPVIAPPPVVEPKPATTIPAPTADVRPVAAAPALDKSDPPEAMPEPVASSTPPIAAEPTPVAEPIVVPPQLLERVEPTASARALRGVENPIIVLRILVDERGRISRVLVRQGIPGSELEAAAISAALRWKFAPATRDGQPVDGWHEATIDFR